MAKVKDFFCYRQTHIQTDLTLDALEFNSMGIKIHLNTKHCIKVIHSHTINYILLSSSGVGMLILDKKITKIRKSRQKRN